MISRRLCGMLLLVTAGAAAAPASAAEPWPVRPVTLVVPFQAGSSPDILARLLAEPLGGTLGQPVVVENRPGASGNLGTAAVAKAAPDGHTIGFSIVGPLALNRFIFPSLPYDTGRDLALVTIVAQQPSVLAVSNAWGPTDPDGFRRALASRPAGLNYGSVGNGSLSHLAMARITRELRSEPAHVPFPGAPALVTALMRDDVQMGIVPAPAIVPLGRDGKLRLLAITSGARSPLLPDLPTLAEAGFPGVRSAAWVGLIAPKAVPSPILERLRDAVAGIVSRPDVRAAMARQYIEPVASTSAEFEATVADEVARWGEFIRANGIRPGG